MSKTLYIYFLVFVSLNASARDQLDSLKKALKTEKNDTSYMKTLVSLIEIAPDGEWETYNSELLTLSEKAYFKKPTGVMGKTITWLYANANTNKGFESRVRGDFDKALEFYSKAGDLYKIADDKKGLATAYSNIAVVLQKKGDIRSALEYLQRSLDMHKELGNKDGIARTLNNMGSVYNTIGNIKKAVDHFQQCLRIREELGEKQDLGIALNNLGFMLQHQGDLDQALIYFERSLKIRLEIKDKEGAATTYINLACLYKETGKDEKAFELFRKSLQMNLEIKDADGTANAYHNIGGMFKDKGIHDSAFFYLKKAVALRRQMNDKEGICVSLSYLASTYADIKKYREALVVGKEAYDLAKQLGYPNALMRSTGILQRTYAKLGDYANAYEMQKEYYRMRDTLSNAENKKAAARAQLKYEYEKKATADSLRTIEEKKVSEAKLEQERTVKYGLYLGIALVLVFAVFMFNRFRVTQKQKVIIEEQKQIVEHQKHIVEEKQKETTDSIQYAKQIQRTLLANHEMANEVIPDSFVVFKPKDIVSGDFYWATKKEDRFYFAVCDSTGHGVPGAFMSLLNISFLNEAINEKEIVEPNKVLDFVRKRLIDNISQEGRQDGMDGILICINTKNKIITYAAAHNAPVIIRKNELIHLEADKMPVGKGDKNEPFSSFSIETQKGDMLYLYTDGYADQFGGPKGKKFRYKQLEEMLLACSMDDTGKQKERIDTAFEIWKGNLEQVDDVCIIGIRL